MEKVSLANLGLVLDYNISCWSASKTDRETSDQVAQNFNSSATECGKFIKKILGNCPELKKISTFAANLRIWIKESTLPYNRGQRIVPNSMFIQFMSDLGAKQTEFNNMVDEFVDQFPDLKQRAQQNQSNFFKEEDCPSPEQVRQEFDFSFNVMPIPEVNQFDGRLGLTSLEGEYKERFEQSQMRTLEKCRNQILERLAEPINIAVTRLTEYLKDMENKSFYKSWVTNIWKSNKSVRQFNFVNSEFITNLCDKIDEMNSRYTNNDYIKNNTSNNASNLLFELEALQSEINKEFSNSLITYGEELHVSNS